MMMIVYSKYLKSKSIVKVIAFAITLILYSFNSNNDALYLDGQEIRILKCGFSHSLNELYGETIPQEQQSKMMQGEVTFFWLVLHSNNERYYDRSYFENETIPIRVKILRKTGIKYSRASTLVPIIDERTFSAPNPEENMNYIFAYVPIEDQKSHLSVTVVNLRNRPVECINSDNCQFDLNPPLK